MRAGPRLLCKIRLKKFDSQIKMESRHCGVRVELAELGNVDGSRFFRGLGKLKKNIIEAL